MVILSGEMGSLMLCNVHVDPHYPLTRKKVLFANLRFLLGDAFSWAGLLGGDFNLSTRGEHRFDFTTLNEVPFTLDGTIGAFEASLGHLYEVFSGRFHLCVEA